MLMASGFKKYWTADTDLEIDHDGTCTIMNLFNILEKDFHVYKYYIFDWKWLEEQSPEPMIVI